MTEETTVAEQEVATQVEPSAEVKEEKQVIKSADHNWQETNKILKQQKQEIEELRYRVNNPPQQAQPVVEEKDEFADLDPEEFVTVAKARKMAERTAQKQAEVTARKIVQEYAQQQTISNDEQVARGKYQDYDYVLENFAIPLIKNDPALAHKIQTSKNPALTAYRLGKLSDAYEEYAMEQKTSPKAEKIIKNSQRPVSSSALGSPLKTQADQFSNMSREQVWEASQKYARGA